MDAFGGIIGIVTPADFSRPGTAGDKAPAAPADVVGRIMTRRVQVAHVGRHLADLVPLFGGTGHHHIPIVAEQGRLVGIITQTDLVAALAGPNARPAPPGGA